MADKRLHITVGVLFGMLYFWIAKQYFKLSMMILLLGFIVIVIYSTLPDIDHQGSFITWMFIQLSAVLILVGYLSFKFELVKKYFPQNLVLFGLILLIMTILGVHLPHRGVTHTIQFVILSPLLLLTLIKNIPMLSIFLLIGLGILSGWTHLLMDGIPLKVK